MIMAKGLSAGRHIFLETTYGIRLSDWLHRETHERPDTAQLDNAQRTVDRGTLTARIWTAFSLHQWLLDRRRYTSPMALLLRLRDLIVANPVHLLTGTRRRNSSKKFRSIVTLSVASALGLRSRWYTEEPRSACLPPPVVGAKSLSHQAPLGPPLGLAGHEGLAVHCVVDHHDALT